MIQYLDEKPKPLVFRFVRDKRTNQIIALNNPKHFSPQHHEWVDGDSSAPVVGLAVIDDSSRFKELKDKRVWLHGSDEEKSEYDVLKAKFSKDE